MFAFANKAGGMGAWKTVKKEEREKKNEKKKESELDLGEEKKTF